MRLYKLGNEGLSERLHEESSSGMALLDVMERMSGFVTIVGDKFIFTKELDSDSLQESDSPIPLTHAYRVRPSDRASLRISQAMKSWMELEASLKEDFNLEDDTDIMYISKLNRSFFVMADHKLTNLDLVDRTQFLEDVRHAEFESEILMVLDGLYEEYYNETIEFRKTLTSVRIKSLLATLVSNGCLIPEKFWEFSHQ